MNHTLQELIDLATNEYMKRELSLLKYKLEGIQDDMKLADDYFCAADTSLEAEAFTRAFNGIDDILNGSNEED